MYESFIKSVIKIKLITCLCLIEGSLISFMENAN